MHTKQADTGQQPIAADTLLMRDESLKWSDAACGDHEDRDQREHEQSDCKDHFIRTFEDWTSSFFFAEGIDENARRVEDAGDESQLQSGRVEHPDAVGGADDRKETCGCQRTAACGGVRVRIRTGGRRFCSAGKAFAAQRDLQIVQRAQEVRNHDHRRAERVKGWRALRW